MNEIKKFKDGEWIVNEDGICQVHGSADYYVEEFFNYEFENLEIGDMFENKLVYKIFCKFDGAPRKTKYFNYLPSCENDPLDGEYLNTFELCKASNKDHYEKFITRMPSKPVSSRVEFSLRLDPNNLELTIESINELLNNIQKPFCFNEFDIYIRENTDIIFPDRLYANRNVLTTNTLFSLVYNVLEPRNKKYSFSGGSIVKTYCPLDKISL